MRRMAVFAALVDWTKATFAPLGPLGLFILSFIESSFFPIPPDILLIILVLADPNSALFYALVATTGSTIGGIFGYYIGYLGEKTVLEKFVKKGKIEKAHELFEKYETGAIFIAGFTPIPYKVFTIAAGLFYINFHKFVIASFFSRGSRFFTVALLVMFYGEEIVNLINSYFNILTLVVALLIVIAYFIVRKNGKRKA